MSVSYVLYHPEVRCPASVTVSYIMSSRTSFGDAPAYLSRMASVSGYTSGCLDRRTALTVFPVFEKVSCGYYTPLHSLSVIHWTMAQSFLIRTRLM